jgi:hypothetical protein
MHVPTYSGRWRPLLGRKPAESYSTISEQRVWGLMLEFWWAIDIGPREIRTPELSPKSVHTRLVHSGGNFRVFLGSDVLHRCGDRRLKVEV